MYIRSGKFFLLALLLSGALGACGQKGPLIAPPSAQKEVPPPGAQEEIPPGNTQEKAAPQEVSPLPETRATDEPPRTGDDGALNNE